MGRVLVALALLLAALLPANALRGQGTLPASENHTGLKPYGATSRGGDTVTSRVRSFRVRAQSTRRNVLESGSTWTEEYQGKFNDQLSNLGTITYQLASTKQFSTQDGLAITADVISIIAPFTGAWAPLLSFASGYLMGAASPQDQTLAILLDQFRQLHTKLDALASSVTAISSQIDAGLARQTYAINLQEHVNSVRDAFNRYLDKPKTALNRNRLSTACEHQSPREFINFVHDSLTSCDPETSICLKDATKIEDFYYFKFNANRYASFVSSVMKDVATAAFLDEACASIFYDSDTQNEVVAENQQSITQIQQALLGDEVRTEITQSGFETAMRDDLMKFVNANVGDTSRLALQIYNYLVRTKSFLAWGVFSWKHDIADCPGTTYRAYYTGTCNVDLMKPKARAAASCFTSGRGGSWLKLQTPSEDFVIAYHGRNDGFEPDDGALYNTFYTCSAGNTLTSIQCAQTSIRNAGFSFYQAVSVISGCTWETGDWWTFNEETHTRSARPIALFAGRNQQQPVGFWYGKVGDKWLFASYGP